MLRCCDEHDTYNESIVRLPIGRDIFKSCETSYYDGEVYPTEAGLWSMLPQQIVHHNFFQLLFRLYAYDLHTGDGDYDTLGNYHNTDMPMEMIMMVKALNCDVQYYCRDVADVYEYSETYKWMCNHGTDFSGEFKQPCSARRNDEISLLCKKCTTERTAKVYIYLVQHSQLPSYLCMRNTKSSYFQVRVIIRESENLILSCYKMIYYHGIWRYMVFMAVLVARQEAKVSST